MKQRRKPIIQFWYCENVIFVRTFSWLRIVIFTAKKSFCFCRAMVFFFLFAIFCSSLRKNGGLIGRLLSKVTFKYLYNGKQNWIAMILGQERNCLDCIEIFDSLFLLRLARLATGTGILVYNFSILRSIHQICCCYKAWNARIKKTLQQFKGHWFWAKKCCTTHTGAIQLICFIFAIAEFLLAVCLVNRRLSIWFNELYVSSHLISLADIRALQWAHKHKHKCKCKCMFTTYTNQIRSGETITSQSKDHAKNPNGNMHTIISQENRNTVNTQKLAPLLVSRRLCSQQNHQKA